MLYFTNETARVERRCWAPVENGNYLVIKKCGIPKTCAKPDCGSYGALDPGKRTLIGRVTHGGGVAVEIYPVDKQRAMHPALLVNQGRNTDTVKRQYNQPGILSCF